MSNKIVALVPMRHDSQRVVGKNYRLFADKPLYRHVLDNLLACALVDQVVIDTDSPIIHDQVQAEYPSVILIDRPQHLRDGGVPMNDVLLNTVQQVPADFYLQTHSTNPLVTSATLEKAISTFLDNQPMYDSLFSVTRLQTRLWDSLARAINHNPAILLRTQDLPPIYEENSCIYIFSREILESQHNRVGKRPFLFEIAALEAQDIDEESDFLIAELLYKQTRGLI